MLFSNTVCIKQSPRIAVNLYPLISMSIYNYEFSLTENFEISLQLLLTKFHMHRYMFSKIIAHMRLMFKSWQKTMRSTFYQYKQFPVIHPLNLLYLTNTHQLVFWYSTSKTLSYIKNPKLSVTRVYSWKVPFSAIKFLINWWYPTKCSICLFQVFHM